MKEILSLAYYLPQFHEIPENDKWWGKGFTEWSNLRDSINYSSWHEIRKPTAPYGEYNLLDPEIMSWQHNLAQSYGISGFLVWDYWFGNGERLLEKPSELILNNNIEFKYSFCWANHSWLNKRTGEMLKEQKYLGTADYEEYFYKNLPHFKSDNYIKVDGKPVFGVFLPHDIPDLENFVSVFRRLAVAEGFPGIYFIAESSTEQSLKFFDRFLNSNASFKLRKTVNPFQYLREVAIKQLNMNWVGPVVYDYERTILKHTEKPLKNEEIPVLFTGWDTTPRHKRRGTICRGFNPSTFKKQIKNILEQLEKQDSSTPIIIIKSWNEWAEGNLLEPDSVFGHEMLEAYKISFQK
ncbi:hypothetical protein AO265_22460 [Pseudomonas sp. ABAC61]|nr:hypothetical protein AO265_22460 [Pseudomonas sp. ABAC61]